MVFLRISILELDLRIFASEHLEHEALNWIQLHIIITIIKGAIRVSYWPPVKFILKQIEGQQDHTDR